MPNKFAVWAVWSIWTLFKAGCVSFVAQLVVSAYQWGQTSRWQYSWRWFALGTIGLFVATLLWVAWQRVHRRSATRIRNAFPWSSLGKWISTNKAVTTSAGIGVALTALFASTFHHVLESSNEKVRTTAAFLNEHLLTFDVLGHRLNAVDVFTLECLGFLLGFAATLVYRLKVPPAPEPGTADHKGELATAIRGIQSGFPLQDLQRTLLDFRASVANDPACNSFDWSEVDRQLKKLGVEIKESHESAVQTAAHIITIGPTAETAYKTMLKSLFDVTKPGWRHLLFVLLMVALLLTTLPILLRVLLLFLPQLSKGIST